MPRRIAFLIYPRFQILDATGPMAAFEIAERYCPGTYTLSLIAARPGTVQSSAAVSVQARGLPRKTAPDTLVVVGGVGADVAAADTTLLNFVRAAAQRARRIVSVCSGAYVLAASGLLDGKRATTHWSRETDFAQRFPEVHLETQHIFIRQGHIWTSAGITAGIDLALALIAEDLGESIAARVARQLVVYRRRPGGQSQHSALLEMESCGGRFGALLDHVRSNLRTPFNVERLAELACMSPRHFARVFREETGVAPAKAVERLRAEAARSALESGARSIQDIARQCGFGDVERMRRSFVRIFGTPPSVLKRRHQAH